MLKKNTTYLLSNRSYVFQYCEYLLWSLPSRDYDTSIKLKNFRWSALFEMDICKKYSVIFATVENRIFTIYFKNTNKSTLKYLSAAVCNVHLVGSVALFCSRILEKVMVIVSPTANNKLQDWSMTDSLAKNCWCRIS